MRNSQFFCYFLLRVAGQPHIQNVAQKAELALLELEIEKERAKRRQGQRSDVDETITKILDNLPPSEGGKLSSNIEKGEAIKIVAKRHGISSKTLYIW